MRERRVPPNKVLDVRDATMPERFEVQVPKGAPRVVTVPVDDLGFGVTSTFGGPAQEPMTGRSLPASLDDPNARTRSARHFEIAEPKALFVQEAGKCIVLPLGDRVAERMDAVGALRVGDNVHVRHTEAVALSVSKP